LAPANQIHDFNPGVQNYPSGLFWTTPIPAGSVQVNPGAGRASYHLRNFAIPDYGNIANSLGSPNPPSNPGVISFDVEWRGVNDRLTISDGTTFRADVVENTAVIAWTATTQGVTYVSEAPNPSTNQFAEIGHEHSGRFFS
jgi:hypothetical protein